MRMAMGLENKGGLMSKGLKSVRPLCSPSPKRKTRVKIPFLRVKVVSIMNSPMSGK